MTETSTAKIKLVVDNDSVCTVPYYKAQYRDSVLEALGNMLERAQQGEIDAICVGYVTSDGAIGGEWSDGELVGQMLGSLALLQHRMLIVMEDEDGDPPDEAA